MADSTLWWLLAGAAVAVELLTGTFYLLMLGIGMAVGLTAALVLGRLIRTQLFGVEPADPLIVAGAVIMLLGIGLAAGLIPGRRATQINVVSALRYE